MVRQSRRDTRPELDLRKELFRRGLRYRVQVPVVTPRRKHDVVFTRSRVVVDIRGCFWHGCPLHGTSSKSHSEWWAAKIAANRERDCDTEKRLRKAGWLPIVVWEHEDPRKAAQRIEKLVRRRSIEVRHVRHGLDRGQCGDVKSEQEN
jgi:DNA mismatch endonuclease (patch repair protein)